jgi:hypothetical protein
MKALVEKLLQQQMNASQAQMLQSMGSYGSAHVQEKMRLMLAQTAQIITNPIAGTAQVFCQPPCWQSEKSPRYYCLPLLFYFYTFVQMQAEARLKLQLAMNAAKLQSSPNMQAANLSPAALNPALNPALHPALNHPQLMAALGTPKPPPMTEQPALRGMTGMAHLGLGVGYRPPVTANDRMEKVRADLHVLQQVSLASLKLELELPTKDVHVPFVTCYFCAHDFSNFAYIVQRVANGEVLTSGQKREMDRLAREVKAIDELQMFVKKK